MEKILVAGATGTTGNKVINLLKESSQYTPVAMVRNESQQKEFENQGVTTVWGDLTEDVSNTTYVFTDNYSSITPTGGYIYKYKVIVYDKNNDPGGCNATSNKESITVTIN